MAKERRLDLDILKVIGLLCIILAHVNPPGIIFQLRNFDVVLMIIISAYLGMKSFKKNSDVKKYYFKRFKRLVVPTWIFLMILFIIMLIIKPNLLSWKIILDSFILNEGIGYVWIIRIYLIVALLIPLCKKLTEKYNKKAVIISTLILYIVYELLYHYGVFNNVIVLYLLAYIIPCYSLIILSHYMFDDKKALFESLGINFLIFIIMGYIIYKQTGQIKTTQIQKYPFRLYYLSYAILCSTILILILKNKKICNLFSNKIVTFIASNSLWIYLWHILCLYACDLIKVNWIIKYAIVVIASILITQIQSLIVNKLEGKINKSILEILKG